MSMRRCLARRRGLTLMELVVVMVILIALAGIIVPLLPNLISRAHTSTAATNISEINKWVTTYYGLYLKYPDQLDSLTNGTAAINYLPSGDLTNPTTTIAGGLISLGTVTATEQKALADGGITRLADMLPTAPAPVGSWSPTFFPYNAAGTAPTFTAITSFNKLLVADANTVALKTGASSTGKYLVFGLGQASTMMAKMIFDVPVHFEDQGGVNPGNAYQRFGLLFKVSDATAPFDKLEYVGAVGIHTDDFAVAGNEISEYYNLTSGK